MKELTIKELAPYLPYKLKVKRKLTGETSEVVSLCMNTVYSTTRGRIKYSLASPVLRPLSDLTKDIDENEKGVSFNDWITSEYDFNIEMYLEKLGVERLPYEIVEYLFEWHFDVFGLIDSGLAIDKNTLSTTTNK